MGRLVLWLISKNLNEAALAHVDKNEVRRAYNRAEYLERRRVLMCWWSTHINKAATIGFNDLASIV